MTSTDFGNPDVIVVGEMRDPETMRLTLNAAETGHLVISTLHSSTGAEALQRMTSAFPAEIQASVRAQLADCLVGVLAQRLRYRADLKRRVPECELITASPITSIWRIVPSCKSGVARKVASSTPLR